MHVLDNVEKIHTIDTSNILGLINKFPEQIKDAIAIGNNFDISKYSQVKYENIVFSGMGGSAIGADIIRSLLLPYIKVPIFVNRDYSLPNFVNENTLLVISSYSGDTEETNSALNDGLRRKAKIISITTGGKIGLLSNENFINLMSIPKGIPPRQALAFLVFPILVVFERIFSEVSISGTFDEVIKVLSNIRDHEAAPTIAIERNIAKQISDKIHGKFPVIYTYDEYFSPVALRWRGQFAENSKILCSHHVIPEMNHNEIMAWQAGNDFLKKCVVLILKDTKSETRNSHRVDITERIVRDVGTEVVEIFSKGKSVLSRVMSLIYMADFVSVYIAVLNNVNPISIDKIQYLKKELEKIS